MKAEIMTKTVNLPAKLAECNTETFTALGIKSSFKGVDAARRALEKEGVKVNLMDNAALLIANATSAMHTADKATNNAYLNLALINKYKVWQYTPDPNGVLYGEKGQGRFYKDCFPAFSPKSIITYTTAATQIILPLLEGDPDFKGLEDLKDMSISTLKELNGVCTTPEGRDAVRDAIKTAKKDNRKIGVKDLVDVRHKVNGVKSKKREAAPDAGSATAGEIAEQLTGGVVTALFTKTCNFSWTGDEFYMGTDKPATLITILSKAANDKDFAVAVCNALLTECKKVVPAKEIKE